MTKVTDQINSVTHQYISDNAQQFVYNAGKGIALMLDKAEVKYHGGKDSFYPYRSTGISTNYYDGQYDGTIQSAITPVSTDLMDAAHQEGWSYWYKHEASTHGELVCNISDTASVERAISLSKLKADALLDDVGYMFDQNIANGDGTNNTILGLVKVMDITNSNYLGWDFTGADAALAPKNTTIATSYTTLTMADLFEAYGGIEDAGRFADTILAHPDVFKRLRTLSENTVERTQGGNASIGHLNFDVLGADIIPWRAMPTTTATKIYFLNFGNHVKLGVKGDSTPSVKEGSNWVLEIGGAKGDLGIKSTGWEDWTSNGYPGVMMNIMYGAFKLACTKPSDQAYISIA